MFNKFKKFDYLTFCVSDEYLKIRIASQRYNGLFMRLVSYTRNLIRSLDKLFVRLQRSDVVFLWSTDNQRKSLEEINTRYKEDFGQHTSTSYSLKNSVLGDVNYPESYHYLISLFFFPFAIIECIYSILSKKEYAKYAHGLDRYLTSFGQYFSFYILLSIIRPKIVVISNDHNVEMRVIIHLAKMKKIKTVFVQHASPNQNLPELSQFDFALLDGQASLDIYKKIGSIPPFVKLIGISKLDPFKQKHLNDNLIQGKGKFLSIALNSLYDINILKTTISEINKLGYKVRLRVHPSQRNYIENISENLDDYDVIISNPINEDLFEFILNSKVLIAGNSNILLESAILGVDSCYLRFDDLVDDYYGFVSSRLVLDITNDIEILKDIMNDNNSFVPDRTMLKYYDNSVGEHYFGFSSSIAAQYINEIRQKI